MGLVVTATAAWLDEAEMEAWQAFLTELAARTLVSRSGLTRRLDRLVDAGLVQRQSSVSESPPAART